MRRQQSKLTRGNFIFQGLDFAALFDQCHTVRVRGVDADSWKQIFRKEWERLAFERG